MRVNPRDVFLVSGHSTASLKNLTPMAIKMGSATASPLLRTIQPVTQVRNQVLGLNIAFTKSFGVVVVCEAKAER